jgi:hypothetical protein
LWTYSRFIRGYLQQREKDLEVISYSQASRSFKKLNIRTDDHRADNNNMENTEIAIVSSRSCGKLTL